MMMADCLYYLCTYFTLVYHVVTILVAGERRVSDICKREYSYYKLLKVCFQNKRCQEHFFLCEAMRVRWILDELLCLHIPFRVTQAFCVFTIHYVSCDNKVRPDQDIILVILMMVEILCHAVVKFCSVGSLFGLFF